MIRARLTVAGARPGFRGLMSDVRYDRNGELQSRDEVLRVRVFHHPDGRRETVLGWKGATRISGAGYKSRPELEYDLRPRGDRLEDLLAALGYQRVHAVDRYVEYYHLGSADLRLEWYPRMDVLIEVEGDAADIEAGLRAVGLPRQEFSAESLAGFAERYAARTGRRPVLSTADLADELPSWATP